MQAVILAGGLGTRLRPLVSDKPKALAPIRSRPFLEYQIAYLASQGVDSIVLCLGHQAEQVEEYLRRLSGPSTPAFVCCVEPSLRGTAGAVKFAERHLEEQFVLLNGDTYLRADLGDVVKSHFSRQALVTIVLARWPVSGATGSVALDAGGRVVAFLEKAAGISEAASWLVNAGCYVMDRRVLDYIPESQTYSLEYDLLPDLVRRDLPVWGYIYAGPFLDIGTPEGYARAQTEIGGDTLAGT